MGRRRVPQEKKKARVLLTLNKSIYENLRGRVKLSRLVNSLLGAYVDGLHDEQSVHGRITGRLASGAIRWPNFIHLLSLDEFIDVISKKDITPKWKRKVLSALTKITQEADKSIYENPEAFCRFFQDNAAGISSRKNRALVARLLFAFAHQRGFITRQQLEELKGHVRVKRIRPDRYVPTQDEVRATLARLPQHHRQAFLTLLYSGLRLSELQYLVERKVELRAQAINGFVKVELAYERRTKSAFFAYLPRELWTQLPTSFSVNALEDYVHRKDCLRAKYLRKIFYTTAIRIGCPAEVADFIQGRVQRTVGGNHYLALQQLADIWYPKIAREFSRGKLT